MHAAHKLPMPWLRQQACTALGKEMRTMIVLVIVVKLDSGEDMVDLVVPSLEAKALRGQPRPLCCSA